MDQDGHFERGQHGEILQRPDHPGILRRDLGHQAGENRISLICGSKSKTVVLRMAQSGWNVMIKTEEFLCP